MLRLSILDQSIVPKGTTPSQAIAHTIELARKAEDWGFHRFWVSEHHNSTMIAGSAPELLMVRLAAETKKIRIGSGGIMLRSEERRVGKEGRDQVGEHGGCKSRCVTGRY